MVRPAKRSHLVWVFLAYLGLTLPLVYGVNLGGEQGGPPTDLIVAYAFDEGTGTTATDYSGNGRGATLFGPTWTTQGRFGGALSFDGVNDRVTGPVVLLPSTFTFMAWVFNPSNSPYETIVTVGTPRSVYLGTGVVYFQDGSDRSFGPAIPTNAWQHVAVVSDGAVLRAYVNGVARGTAQPSALASASGVIQVGAWMLGGGNYDFFGGRIDEIRIYNRGLSQLEIQNVMNVPVGPPLDTVPPTVVLTEPAAGAQLSGLVTARAAASDAVGVAGVQFLLDGAPLGAEDVLAPFELAWNTTTASNGSHSVAARARDAAGNVATSTASGVTVQNNPPRLTITAPASGATAAGTVVGVRYTISVPPPHPYHAHFRLDGGPTVMDIDADGIYQLSNVPIGAHTLTGIVAAQNHSEIPNSDMTVTFATVRDPSDPEPPSVIVTAPGAGATVVSTVEIRADAVDNVGISGVQFFVDGAAVASAGANAASWNTATASDGPHTLTALARDIAGNETMSLPVNVTVANAPGGVSQVGQWSGVIPWPMAPVHAILQPSGEVLLWDQGFGGLAARLWNPGTGAMSSVPLNSANNIFCSGHVLLADGQSAVIGGQVNPCCYNGTRETNLFDASTRTWTRMRDMNYPRWYPTATTLPDGRVLTVSGTISQTMETADIPEIYDPDTNTWTPLTTAALRIPLYPFMFVLPDGRVFNAGPDVQTRVLDIASGTWTDVGTSFTTGHGAVMYGAGRIMKAGTLGDLDNQLPSVNGTTAVIDMTQSAPAWRQVAPMAFPRAYHTLTLLADGTVIAVGGERTTSGGNTAQAVYDPEIWNPGTETWRTVARMQRPRLYHSSALLLPDGRVLVSGGDLASYLEPNAEIYSPPYLFRGPRPTISSVPQTLSYGANVPIDTPDAAGITRVSLVRLGSVTHGVDMNQRYLQLPFTRNGQRLNVQAPGGPNLAPPGHYMLFLMNVSGAPSTAAIVRLAPSVDPEAPTAPANLSATAADTSVSLAWTASTDNVGVTRYNVHRGGAPGVSPSLANRIGQSATTVYADGTATPGTYYYVVAAEDAAGNLSGPSNEAAATVIDAAPPVLSNGQPSGSLPSGTTQATVSATTNEAAVCRYSSVPNTAFVSMPSTFVVTGGLSHSTPVTGLSNGASYVVYVRCQDAAGNASAADFPIAFSVALPPVDTTPPVRSSGAPSGVLPAGTTSANLTLQTNETATCRYSASAGTSYDAMTSVFATVGGTSHSATVSGLTNGGSFTLYVRCRDLAANTNVNDFPISFSVAVPPGSTLRVEYGFNATSGTSAVDSSGNANHGTVSGATWTTQGRYAGALSFDGTNDRVVGPTLALGAQFSYTAWIYNPSNTAYETIVTVGTQRDFFLGSGMLSFYSNDVERSFGAPAVTTNTWHHVAVVSNGTTLRAYLNGNAYGNVLNVALGAYSGRLDVGAWNTTADVFGGRIDQVRVYSTALTQAQVQQDLATIVPPQP